MSEAAELSRDQVKEYLKNLSLLDAAALVKELEQELGVSAAAPVAMAAAAPAAGAAAAPAAEKDEFDRLLTAAGDKKIQVIKVVRELTGLRSERGQGPGRWSAQSGQRRHRQGGSRGCQEKARRGWGLSRVEVGAGGFLITYVTGGKSGLVVESADFPRSQICGKRSTEIAVCGSDRPGAASEAAICPAAPSPFRSLDGATRSRVARH